MDLLISMVNAGNLGWKASTCKLQKHHNDYGKGENCDNNELVQNKDDPIDANFMLISNEDKETM